MQMQMQSPSSPSNHSDIDTVRYVVLCLTDVLVLCVFFWSQGHRFVSH